MTPNIISKSTLIRGRGFGEREKPIRFDNMWLKKEGFVERVQVWWDRYSFSRRPTFVLADFILLSINLQFPHVLKNFTCHFY